MGRILDVDDYCRRLDQAVEISTGEEIGLLVKGILTGDSFGPLNAHKLIAKQNASIQARREMLLVKVP